MEVHPLVMRISKTEINSFLNTKVTSGLFYRSSYFREIKKQMPKVTFSIADL